MAGETIKPPVETPKATNFDSMSEAGLIAFLTKKEVAPVRLKTEKGNLTIPELLKSLNRSGASMLLVVEPHVVERRGIDAAKIETYRAKHKKLLSKLKKLAQAVTEGGENALLQSESETLFTEIATETKPLVRALERDETTPLGKSLLGNELRAVEAGKTYISPDANSLAELNDLAKLTPIGFDQIITEEGGREKITRKLAKHMRDALDGIPAKVARALGKKLPEYKTADDLKKWIGYNLMNNAARGDVVRADDITAYLSSIEALGKAVQAMPSAERAKLIEIKDESSKKTAVNAPKNSKEWTMSGTATATLGEQAPTPSIETKIEIGDFKDGLTVIAHRLDEYNARISKAAQNNPAAIITAVGSKYVREYRPLLKEINAECEILTDLTLKGTPSEERMEAIVDKLAQLDLMSTEIAEYLKGQTAHTPTQIPSGEKTETTNERVAHSTTAPEKPKSENGELQNVSETLALSRAFRSEWRGTNDIEKGKNENGEWYVKEKAELGETLKGFYTRDLFAKMGSGARALLGMKASALPPELQALKNAASDAAQAYSSSIEARYVARLDREVAAGRLSPALHELRHAQFRALMANRFVFQSMDMVRSSERSALSGMQENAVVRFGRWFNSRSKTEKILYGSAITVAAGAAIGAVSAFAAGTAIAGGALAVFGTKTGIRVGLNALMVAGGFSVGRTVNDVVVNKGHENVKDVAETITGTFSAKDMSVAQERYRKTVQSLDKRKAVGTALGALAGGVTAGLGVSATESALDWYSPDTPSAQPEIPRTETPSDAEPVVPSPTIEKPTLPRVYPDSTPTPSEGAITTPPALEKPSVSLDTEPSVDVISPPAAPSEDMHVVQKGDTVWNLLENNDELTETFNSGHERDVALMNVRQSLIDDPTLAKDIGINSGHPDLIRYPSGSETGDSLNMTRLEELLHTEIEKLQPSTENGSTIRGGIGSDTLVGMNLNDEILSDSVIDLRGENLAQSIGQEVADGKTDLFGEKNTPAIEVADGKGDLETHELLIDTDAVTPSTISRSAVLAGGAAATLATIGNIAENTKKRKDAIIRALGDAPDTFWSRFSSRTDSAYRVLKGMTVGAISRDLSRLKPSEQELYAKVNGIEDTKSLVHWMQNFELWKTILVGTETNTSRLDALRFDDFLTLIAKHQEERGEPLPPPAV